MRPRKRDNRTLPPNLYTSKKGRKYYFSYRHPQTGKVTGMGSDRQAAVRAAHTLNAQLVPAEKDLVARVVGGDGNMAAWLDRFTDLYAARRVKGRPIAPDSIRAMKVHIKRMRAEFGTRDISSITTKEISDYLDSFADTPTMAKCTRSALNTMFKTAIQKGLISENPVAPTRVEGVEVQRSRLSLDEYTAIYKAAGTLAPWVCNSMLLAITTGQRLKDIAAMQFKDVQDGYLHIQQHKTGSKVRLSLELGLPGIGTIGDAVAQCRDIVVSRWMLHHLRKHGSAAKGDPIHQHSISRGFLQARQKTRLRWPSPAQPPSFHEIRSLSGRLYGEQGVDVQSLLGHADPATTALYVDVRGSEWVSVG